MQNAKSASEQTQTTKLPPNAPRSVRPQTIELPNGVKAPLPFSNAEYQNRLSGLRSWMNIADVPVVILTSMHNIAYYSGFLYCSFGRPYACVVTDTQCTTVSANIDYGQPWRRSVGDNVVYTDWERDNYWRAIKNLASGGRRVAVEADHMTLDSSLKLAEFLGGAEVVDAAPATMRQRMIKSPEEIKLITSGAAVADIGGHAIRDAIVAGAREIDIAAAGRNAMEFEIASRFPDSELRDSWVWFQSGLNTDGAHNPVTTRRVKDGDILSLNAFPMISGYYTALERTLFLGQPDTASTRLWEANVGAHELGLSMIKPGVSCAAICEQINRYFEDKNLLDYRTFGYGHSFGLLSHYYGREAGLEIREDIDTVLQPGMVVSIEPMLTIPEGTAGAGGYREHDILVVTESGATNITGFPYGPAHNIV